MGDIAIKAENISKAYQLGEFSTGTLSRDIERWWALMRGKEDPFLKIGEANDRALKGTSDVVWSLKDINFEIKEGDAVGIIGRNGAGKSTLLKVLSRITSPTTGNIKVKGRIASLLEVGTGFHPELTGGENVYLNGAIMGMSKREIKRKFDEIIDFAGVERYINTPVKRYSSGMYVRLAFAVAAYLDSEILVVDEVLAVGDAEFQKKCIGKMQDVSKSEGRTILFVSHNMSAVQNLCTRGILLDKGIVIENEIVEKVIPKYLNLYKESTNNIKSNSILKEISVKTIGENSKENGYYYAIKIKIDNFNNERISVDLFIKNFGQTVAFISSSYHGDLTLNNGYNEINLVMGPVNFCLGSYEIDAQINVPRVKTIETHESVIKFDVETQINNSAFHAQLDAGMFGYFIPINKWQVV